MLGGDDVFQGKNLTVVWMLILCGGKEEVYGLTVSGGWCA